MNPVITLVQEGLYDSAIKFGELTCGTCDSHAFYYLAQAYQQKGEYQRAEVMDLFKIIVNIREIVLL